MVVSEPEPIDESIGDRQIDVWVRVVVVVVVALSSVVG